MVLIVFTKPEWASSNGGHPAVLKAMVVFRERHAPAAGDTYGEQRTGPFALCAGGAFRFLHYKKAFQVACWARQQTVDGNNFASKRRCHVCMTGCKTRGPAHPALNVDHADGSAITSIMTFL